MSFLYGRAKPLKSELRRRGIWQGLLPHVPDDWGRQLAAGGGVGFKTEHRHRGMKLGIAPHSPDYWGRQLAAGGNSRALNPCMRENAVRVEVRRPRMTITPKACISSCSAGTVYHQCEALYIIKA